MFGRLFVNLRTCIQIRSSERASHGGECASGLWIQEQTYEGVIRRLSSIFKLGRLKRDEDDRTIAPASIAYSRQPRLAILYALWCGAVVFIHLVGKPRPECMVIRCLTPFL